MPTAKMNISLPEALKEFVETQASKEGFETVSDYIQTVIRQLQKQEARQKIETELLEGLKSGPATPMTALDWDDVRREVHARHTRRKNGKKKAR